MKTVDTNISCDSKNSALLQFLKYKCSIHQDKVNETISDSYEINRAYIAKSFNIKEKKIVDDYNKNKLELARLHIKNIKNDLLDVLPGHYNLSPDSKKTKKVYKRASRSQNDIKSSSIYDVFKSHQKNMHVLFYEKKPEPHSLDDVVKGRRKLFLSKLLLKEGEINNDLLLISKYLKIIISRKYIQSK
ncbi:hypothetical protein A3Q56_01365 [Intoshia linei]|uniref:Uncharacterized protein n=1 Tax=Intoshia linei TaxID=1819745 RepID=A0A177B988_9BILA|nr:hypothetical protein A3Q56_01365 [Intoshia linei]